MDATRVCLGLILNDTTDETTRERLLREVIEPTMEKHTKSLERKVSEIMRPHRKGHPITYNHYFTETVQKARQEHNKKALARGLNAFFKLNPEAGPTHIYQNQGFNTADLLDALTQQTEHDMDRYACSEAVDCMEAYYKVSPTETCTALACHKLWN